jgi:hypothetical protein
MERGGKAASSKKATGRNGNDKAAKHTQADLVAFAKARGIEGADFEAIMTNASFKNADQQAIERWDEIVRAIDISAGKVATPGL